MRRAWPAERLAAAAIFLLFGLYTGSFSSRLPWIADRLHLTSGTLGLCVGLMASIGAIGTIPFAARLVHKYGTRLSTAVTIAAVGVTLALPPFAPDVVVLALIMLVTGAVGGTCDNALNAQGVEAERRIGRSMMSGLHGMWSVGVLAGALLGALAAREGVDPRVQFTVIAAVITAGGVTATRWLGGGRPLADDSVEAPRFVWPRGVLLLIGLVGFASIFVEYAANDWSAVFMRWVLHASQEQAALATAIFAGSMAIGRLCGDAIVQRTGPGLVVGACGTLGTIGCLLVAFSPGAGAALAGFLLVGAGVSVVIPLVFAAAGRSGASPALGVAAVATISYGAGLAAPGAMGGIADLSSLRVAFGVAAVLALTIAAGARLFGQAPTQAATVTAGEPVRRRSA
ncbi:MAG TPA: MFS transporter [Streptosporangiaceae bacterium]|jgi:MFS family permease